MKNNIFFCVLFLFCFIFNISVNAKSPVWKISKNGHHLFLGGTFHLLTDSDYPLPSAFEAAYNNSELLVLETDIQRFSAPEFQQTILQSTMYTGEQNISHFLEPDTMQALITYLAIREIPKDPMIKFKSGMLSITLTMIEMQRLGLVGIGVDEFYSLKALNESREIEYLETVNDQLDFISKMGEGNENELIEHTLNDIKDLGRLFNSMKKAWKNGDNAQLQKVAVDPWKELFPKLHHSLLVERNNNWIPKIEQMLKTNEVEFVLFGSLHLVGDQGVLAQLKTLGYKIENQ